MKKKAFALFSLIIALLLPLQAFAAAIDYRDVATVLWRYEGSPAVADSRNFADESQISSYASMAVDWAEANNIINGKPGNRLDPRGHATRAEIAQILMNYLSTRKQSQSGARQRKPERHRAGTEHIGKLG